MEGCTDFTYSELSGNRQGKVDDFGVFFAFGEMEIL